MNLSSVIKNGFWATYGAIATRMLSLFSNLMLARLLLPSEFGVIGIAYIFWAFVNLFVSQDSAGSFLVYKGIEDKRYVNTAYTLGLSIGLVLALGMVAASPTIASFFGEPNLVWILVGFAFNLILASVQSIYVGIMTRRMLYRELANANLIASMVRVFSTAFCAFVGLSYWSFVIGDTAFWLMLCVLTQRHVKHKFQLQIDPEIRVEVLSYCLGGTGSSLGFYFNANCDNFIIAKLLGNTYLGFYNFAYQLTMALNSILNQAFSQVGMSTFAQLPSDRHQENALLKVVEQIGFLTAPIYALFFLVIDQHTISLIFGTKWIPSSSAIPWLLIFAYFRLINVALFFMLSAKGKPGLNAKINLQIAPIAILSFIIGACYGGIIGVSIAVALVLGIFWTIYSWWIGCRAMGWQLKQFLIPCFLPSSLALLAIVFSLSAPALIKPFVFLVSYGILVRFFAKKQFLTYQGFASKLVQRLSKIGSDR